MFSTRAMRVFPCEEIEIKVWNMATNIDLYKPDNEKSLYVRPLRYRPKLSNSSALKDSSNLENVQKQLNEIYDAAKVKSQIIINHVMEIELKELEGKKCTILQETWKKKSYRIRSWWYLWKQKKGREEIL